MNHPEDRVPLFDEATTEEVVNVIIEIMRIALRDSRGPFIALFALYAAEAAMVRLVLRANPFVWKINRSELSMHIKSLRRLARAQKLSWNILRACSEANFDEILGARSISKPKIDA